MGNIEMVVMRKVCVRLLPLYHLKSCRDDMTTNVAYGGPGNQRRHIVESADCVVARLTLPIVRLATFSHT